MEMIGDHVLIDFAQCSLLRADRAGEIAEMVDGERQVGRHRLADRLAVIPCLDNGQLFQIGFHPVGDAVEDERPFGDGCAAPAILRGMGGVQRKIDVAGIRSRDFADHLAIDRGYIVEIASGARRGPFSADEVVIAGGKGRLQSIGPVLGMYVHWSGILTSALLHVARLWRQLSMVTAPMEGVGVRQDKRPVAVSRQVPVPICAGPHA